MFLAGVGIFAALAFVLGLGALALWGLKRFSNLGLTPRSRIAVEVVQRVSLGPKTGLAVVRVGEKVMALSVGDGGVRQLFELDEADRQRVIASSVVPTPLVSSAQAAASFAKFLPARFGGVRTAAAVDDTVAAQVSTTPAHAMAPEMMTSPTSATRVSAVATDRMTSPMSTPRANALVSPEARFALAALQSLDDMPATTPARTRAGAPATYSPAATPRHANDPFFQMLGMSLHRSAKVAGMIAIAFASVAASAPLHAQVAPPIPPVQQATPPGDSTARATQAQPVVPTVTAPLQAPVIPQPPVAPTLQDTSLRSRAARTATPARPAGNGASVTPSTPNGAKPLSNMQMRPASSGSSRATAAQSAPVAGGDDALARMVPQMDIKLGDGKDGGLRLSGTVGIVVMMGMLTLLPTLLLMMTGFTRILIVLHFLKQAMGTQAAPPAHLLAGLALLLTGFVMAPTLTEVNRDAITPWLDGKITQVEMMKTGVKPMREFMLRQTRESDLKTFIEMSRMERPETPDDVPLHVLMSAFVASELRTAFQIGFVIYLPFIVIDAVVASVLMSMGMFMLPPAMISLPFKLLLFVLVDGWSLTITSLVQSFR